AADLYERALPHIHDPLRRASALQRLGTCLLYANRPGAAGAAERCLEEAVTLFDAAGREVEAARLRVSLADSYYPRMRHGPAEAQLHRAIAVLEPLGPSPELADAYNHLAFFRIVQIDGPSCAAWAKKALAAAEATGAGMALVRAQDLFGLGLACEGFVDEAIEWLDRSAEGAVSRGWSWFALAAMNNTLLFLPLERWDEAPARVERMRAVDPNHFATLNSQAMLAIGQGVPARAAEIAETARQMSANREWTVGVLWTNCTLVHAYTALGRVDDARRALPAARLAVDRQDQLSRWGAELALAEAAARSGTREAAALILEQVISSAQEREHRGQQSQAEELARELDIPLHVPQPPAHAAEPTATGERFVTVLFADVRGYTEMS